MSREELIAAIVRLLHLVDQRALRLIYQFVLHIVK